MKAKELFIQHLKNKITEDDLLKKLIMICIDYSVKNKDQNEYCKSYFSSGSFSIIILDKTIKLDFYHVSYVIDIDISAEEIYATDSIDLIKMVKDEFLQKINKFDISFIASTLYDLKAIINKLSNTINTHTSENKICFEAIDKDTRVIKKLLDDYLVPKVNDLLEKHEEKE
jgi:hypothetical protein